MIRAKLKRLVLTLPMLAVFVYFLVTRKEDPIVLRVQEIVPPTTAVMPTAGIFYHSSSFSSNPACSERNCFQYMTKSDVPHYRYCTIQRSRLPHYKRYTIWSSWTKLRKEPERSLCHFINGRGRNPVALASFAGSGNTWVRGLLQEISGICTGAIYCDTTLRKSGFPGESLRSGITLVVKTHQTDPRWTGIKYDPSAPFKYFEILEDVPIYSAAILIVRNPFDALVAEWNREMTENLSDNHINHVGIEYFRESKEWNAYVHAQAPEWQETIVGWLIKNENHPVIVVKFEELKVNTVAQVTRMLHFLQVPHTDLQVRQVVERGIDEFKRKHHDDFDHFTPEQRKLVTSVLINTLKILEDNNRTSVCNIYDYLRDKDLEHLSYYV